ncbi:agmatine deiminase family protein [Aquibacillus rhizosphaerae]|uniref:Agmatine deiminase family protein n=1 Tax=Aquibacillus rhizosphaerae TaxID=3051431 RepID=A0ABT7LAE5_9BACI|nr:agmatine deiminase family protein [Aquibacillus sp. LR5S19]MDL4842851.1 agmatine deiminase family protein [Aquibacillus sp. LR5S19]
MHKPISSVYGKINRMLLTFPNTSVLPDDIVLQRYKGIFESLDKNVHYVILADKNVHTSIRQSALRSGLDPEYNLTLINATSMYPAYVTQIIRRIRDNVYECELESGWHSIWAQDGYSCIKKEDGTTVLLESLDFTRGGDHFVADQIAAETDLEIEVTKYHIEGGNILAGDNYLIIGKDYLHLNEEITGENQEKITNEFKKLFGVEHVIWLGFDEPVDFPIDVFQGEFQPIFHIDMYVTLGGKADNGKELVFIADVKMAKNVLEEDMPPTEISESLDRTAQWLAEYNIDGLSFEVKRIPIDLWDLNGSTGTFLTYNNCLIEVFEGTKNVYLPAYSSVAPGSINRRKLDEAVANIFSNNGFTVKLLEGAYEELCKRGGSLHCITKDLDRLNL